LHCRDLSADFFRLSFLRVHAGFQSLDTSGIFSDFLSKSGDPAGWIFTNVGVFSFLLVRLSAFADEFFVATRFVVVNLRLLSFDQSTAVDAGELLEKMSILVNLNLIIGHDFSAVRTFDGHFV